MVLVLLVVLVVVLVVLRMCNTSKECKECKYFSKDCVLTFQREVLKTTLIGCKRVPDAKHICKFYTNI